MSNPFLSKTISDAISDVGHRDLLRRATPRAWKYARLFDQALRGGDILVKPGLDSSPDERDGWGLFWLNYNTPPTWLRLERAERRMRQ